MPEIRTAVAVRTEPVRTWTANTLQAGADVLGRTGAWAVDTAQQFGALLSALMGPAIFSVYAFAFWSLADNLGWTNTFVFHSGPLSNWLVWSGIAVIVSLAAGILRRHTQEE